MYIHYSNSLYTLKHVKKIQREELHNSLAIKKKSDNLILSNLMGLVAHKVGQLLIHSRGSQLRTCCSK